MKVPEPMTRHLTEDRMQLLKNEGHGPECGLHFCFCEWDGLPVCKCFPDWCGNEPEDRLETIEDVEASLKLNTEILSEPRGEKE